MDMRQMAQRLELGGLWSQAIPENSTFWFKTLQFWADFRLSEIFSQFSIILQMRFEDIGLQSWTWDSSEALLGRTGYQN